MATKSSRNFPRILLKVTRLFGGKKLIVKPGKREEGKIAIIMTLANCFKTVLK